MEALAVSFTESTAKSLLGKLGHILSQEAGLLSGVEDDIQYIMDEVESMASFLRILPERQGQDHQVTTWMKQVREIAYDAEDSIDMFKHRLGGLRHRNRFIEFLINAYHLLRTLKARRSIATDLKKLKLRAHDVSERRTRYFLTSGNHSGSGSVATIAPKSSDHHPDVQPRGNHWDKNELIRRLIEDNQPKLGVVSIVGVANEARKDLAMNVYQTLIFTSDRFQAHAWIEIPRFSTIEELLRNLITELSISKQQIREFLGDPAQLTDEVGVKRLLIEMGKAELMKMIRVYLDGRRYLIVLDNVYATNVWNGIKLAFPGGKNGSRLVVTTHDKKVVDDCFSHYHHSIKEMAKFSPDESSTNENRPVGIDEPSNTLVGWLLAENQKQLGVISIVGSGGLGKTTLAMTVYQSPDITGGHFPARTSIAVSQSYKIETLLRTMIRELSISVEEIGRVIPAAEHDNDGVEQILERMDEMELVKTINNHLQRKRYLIVLDDLWDVSAWDSIRKALPDQRNGSRVIVTTRNETVANTCSSSLNRQFIYRITRLSPDKSRQLFCTRVFEGPEYTCPSHLKKIMDDILKKCDGLPLAIVTIAGLLANKPEKTREEWSKLHDHLGFELETNASLQKINRILRLSYNDLPYHLKPCLLYLSIFPEDYEIDRKRLVRRWIAEGIVSRRRGMSAEAVAETYFQELVDRNLILPEKFGDGGKVKTCRVHDIMLEVVVSVSMEENFVTVLNKNSIGIPHDKIRRLALHENSTLEDGIYLSQVRSFTLFGNKLLLKDYRKMMMLRVLDLQGYEGRNQNHLKNISKLFLLNYLSLRDNRFLHELPDSIGDLPNLQFLDIRGAYIKKLPNAIVKLKRLSHLLAGGYGHPYGLEFPKGVGKMKTLQELGPIYIDPSDVLQEIGKLTQLRKLSVYFGSSTRDKNMEHLRDSLGKLSNCLRSLTLHDFGGGHGIAVLDGLASSPPSLLEKMSLLGTLGSKLPTWFESLDRIAKITLERTELKHEAIEALAKLPSLVQLRLKHGSFKQEHHPLPFRCGGFAVLNVLEIRYHKVSFQERALQSLRLLKVDCNDEGIEGVQHLSELKEAHLQIRNDQLRERLKSTLEKHIKKPKMKVLNSKRSTY
ncbi:disease resistance protein RPM1-like [Canna indica]|uniref:Disease resistance protein RPM1-like n=1 Tax=Canna indica TaxID=4628 RepID=A0AAQ3QK70_9LILI|nr:disease resistance protein RPM1-like [Canna indica]